MMQPDASQSQTKPNARLADHASAKAHSGRTVVAVIAAAAAAFGVYRLSTGPSGGPAQPTESPQVVREGSRITIPAGSPLRNKLVVDAVRDTDVQRTLVLPAVVEVDPARLVKVLPPLAGRVTQLMVQLGERVEPRQPLLILDLPDLASAQADYERGKVQLDLALKNRDRTRDLAKIGGAAVRDQQQADTDYASAEAEYQRAKARLMQIGLDPDKPGDQRTVTITAPAAGSVIDLAVAPGSYWNDPNAPLMTVADLRTIWVTANVPENDTAAVTKGQPVDVSLPAFPGEVFKGKVLFVSDVLDPDTRRTKVRIEFPNPDIRMKPGMFATVTFLAPKQSRPAIPTAALVLKDDGDRVFVEVEPWVFEPRQVEVGFQQGEQAIIKSGREERRTRGREGRSASQ